MISPKFPSFLWTERTSACLSIAVSRANPDNTSLVFFFFFFPPPCDHRAGASMVVASSLRVSAASTKRNFPCRTLKGREGRGGGGEGRKGGGPGKLAKVGVSCSGGPEGNVGNYFRYLVQQ